MMTREQRAKQFMPFDAMKGLQEALRDREERHSRVEKRECSEEQAEINDCILRQLKPGMEVIVEYYKAFHNIELEGTVDRLSPDGHFLILGTEKIFFSDIYSITLKNVSFAWGY